MELTEWLNGYRGVAEHGFVGLTGIANTGQARSAFAKMDDNGGGIVLLDEWCFYLKGAEIEAGTEIGRLLNMDEEGGVGKKEKLSATRKPLPGRVSAAEVQAKRERRASKDGDDQHVALGVDKSGAIRQKSHPALSSSTSKPRSPSPAPRMRSKSPKAKKPRSSSKGPAVVTDQKGVPIRKKSHPTLNKKPATKPAKQGAPQSPQAAASEGGEEVEAKEEEKGGVGVEEEETF